MYEQLPPGQNPVLPTGSPALMGPYVFTSVQREVAAMPGQDIEFRRGRITAHQLESCRPSYINACLIQSRGSRLPAPCSRCHAHPGTMTFPSCRHLPGAWGGACANCKWSDQASRCSVRDEV
ncbi:hypothetical protein BO83DRAFT_462149 [Aspergillus eucalypticola CBS 122712]|uniref:Uncharacterized protein n=1 Tax=Aspergillus eucalypticola (strain CBS 122712 / IBT 29274) TaxID=1448314 RepID=A0A317UM21_ASPEC|nr:uncharacterized protein BO83DRAFT_462149 [Aspergillus eucalypticola CBS 122712]PWY61667.1 hypothetical protein BO83DRAFT_462149 [Aspergillus eucalypticola CBS 122712]